MARRIPIKNLYYLLCYAWDLLDERDDTLVEKLDGLSHVDLLAKVLTVCVQRLRTRGLDRGYRMIADDVRSPRGRLDVPQMVARRLEDRGFAACRFDELSHDVLHNQIIATTARRLGAVGEIDKMLREDLIALGRSLADVSTIPVRASTFRQLQLHGRLGRYRLPLHICELIQAQLMVDEKTGEIRFRDYVEDERRMARLFQAFVRNFYTRELAGYAVKSDVIHWELEPITPDAEQFLPQMETDISLRGAGRTIIIDTKYYRKAFATRFKAKAEGDALDSEEPDARKLHAGNLYQMTAYLRNIAAKGGPDATAAGVLLYPEVDAEKNPIPTLQYRYGNHRLTVTGIDLAEDWKTIHKRLIDIVEAA